MTLNDGTICKSSNLKSDKSHVFHKNDKITKVEVCKNPEDNFIEQIAFY